MQETDWHTGTNEWVLNFKKTLTEHLKSSSTTSVHSRNKFVQVV